MAENSWTDGKVCPKTDGKIVPGFECYCVTPDGKVWTRFEKGGRRARQMVTSQWSEKTPSPSRKGHMRVELHQLGAGGKVRKFMVHVLVLELFVGPCPEGMEGCHEDGNPANNALSNLRWDTPEGNWSDRKRHGRGCEGEKNPGGGKLTTNKVIMIREMRANGCTLKLISEQVGVSIAMVSKIVCGEAWSHIDG